VSASVSARRENVHPTYRPDIDGLRAVAVLSVVVFHAFPRALPGGFIGVDIFFVISGYLISRIIIESLEQGRFSFAGFYARRIKRLYPALLLVLVAVLAFGWIALFAKEYEQLGKHTAAAAVFISNLVLWSESGYFDNASITKPLLHLWSLGVEEQFYIFWPLLLWLGWRLRFNLLLVAACIGILSFGANVLATTHSPPAAFYSPFTRFWEPMVGAILAYVAAHHRFRRAPVAGATAAAAPAGDGDAFAATSPRVRLAASLLGAGLIVVGVCTIDERNFPGWQVLVPTAGAALLIFAGPRSPFNRYILASRPLVWVGLISYPVYLWHWPLFSFARIVHGEPGVAMRTLLLLGSIILGRLTYAWVEVPLKNAAKRLPLTAVLSVLMVVIGCAGLAIKVQDGLAGRAVVRDNLSLETGRDGGYPSSAAPCAFLSPAQGKLFQCHVDTREPPRFALLGDSKAGALFPGLFRTATPGGTWIYFGSGDSGPLVPVLSDHPIYVYVDRQAVDTALRLIEANDRIEAVAIATSTRALFNLGRDDSIAELPQSRNAAAALAGLDASVSRLVAAGKRVVLVVDNPTLPHPEDCLSRKTSSAFFNELLAAPLNPACRIGVARHLALSRQYRDVLFAIQARHPDAVSVFDTVPILCDEERDVCAPSRNGRFLYGVTDHVSEYGARLIGEQLNARLHPGAASDGPGAPAAPGRHDRGPGKVPAGGATP